MAGAVGVQRDVSRAPGPLFDAEIDRKSPYFHLEIEGSIYLENPMQILRSRPFFFWVCIGFPKKIDPLISR